MSSRQKELTSGSRMEPVQSSDSVPGDNCHHSNFDRRDRNRTFRISVGMLTFLGPTALFLKMAQLDGFLLGVIALSSLLLLFVLGGWRYVFHPKEQAWVLAALRLRRGQ
jgi:hypothetical protein